MFKQHANQPTYICLCLIVCLLSACQNDENLEEVGSLDDTGSSSGQLNLPSTLFDYENIDLPEHFLINAFPMNIGQSAAIDHDNTPTDNPITNEGATLGRVLFYDTNLSADGTVSCGSCHKQSVGFSDDLELSLGFNGGETRRHSMSLSNAMFYQPGKFFWDERAETLEDQVLGPIQDAVEMGLTLDELVDVVEEEEYYEMLFEDAFGDSEVTTDRVAKALAQFVRSMVSTNSKYDQGRVLVDDPFDDFPNFSQLENRGKELFMQRSANGSNTTCITCHQTESFISPANFGNAATTSTQNIGLDRMSSDDYGVMEATGNPDDDGKFKVPSLRNIAVSAPYMHDGRFGDLRDVIRFYSREIEPHDNLSGALRDNIGNPVRFNFSREDQDALVAFLNTLTDEEFLNDEKFSDPFESSSK